MSMRVVRGLWRVLVGIKDFMVLVLLLIFFGGLYAALSYRPSAQPLTGSGALLVRLNGTLVEQPREVDSLALLSGGATDSREYRLRDVVRAVRLAAGDAQVKAVVLDLDGFIGGGQAAIGEVGAALDAVRRAGKPVLAYATGYGDDGYQLAAHASEVWLNPMGAVLIAGPGRPQLYYKGLLDKIGVTTHIYRVGTFKSAVEPFIRTDQSPEARSANQALADALYAAWQDEVRAARPRAQVAAYAADPAAALTAAGGDSANAALRAGLVDRIGDRNGFAGRLRAIAGRGSGRPDEYSGVPFDRYLAAKPESAGAVGVLTIAGNIVDGSAGAGSAAGETIARVMGEELVRKRIKALVVRIDSPGGSAIASERIRGAILAAKAQGLPVVVSMGSVAASGGYWVSTPAQAVFAEPATITGSIGVFGMIPTFQGTLAKLGLSADGVATTPLSGEPDVFRGTSPMFDRLIQTGVENTYARFIGLVAQARGKTPAEVDAIGQGRVWAGGPARQLGLVDRFGGLDDAVAYAADLAKLSGGDRAPRWIEKEPNSWKALLRDWARGPDRDANSSVDPYARLAREPQEMLAGALAEARTLASGPVIQVRCLECGPAAIGPAAAETTTKLLRLFAR